MSTVAESGLIFQKIPAMMKEVGAVTKSRNNQAQGFRFRGIDDIYNALHGLMAKYEIFSVPRVLNVERGTVDTRNGGKMQTTLLTVEYTFYATDGSHFTSVVVGEAADNGDKSAGKAMSYAHKLALIQAFALETDEQQDPDYQSYDLTPAVPQYATYNLADFADDKKLAGLRKWLKENQPQHPQFSQIEAEFSRRKEAALKAKTEAPEATEEPAKAQSPQTKRFFAIVKEAGLDAGSKNQLAEINKALIGANFNPIASRSELTKEMVDLLEVHIKAGTVKW